MSFSNSEYVRDYTNNRQRFPSLQSTATPGKLYFEHEPFSASITVTRAIIDAKYGSRIASVGTQWSYAFLDELWKNVTRDDPGWKDCQLPKRRCLLVSDEAFVLGSRNDVAGKHLLDMEPKLFNQLLNLSLIHRHVFQSLPI